LRRDDGRLERRTELVGHLDRATGFPLDDDVHELARREEHPVGSAEQRELPGDARPAESPGADADLDDVGDRSGSKWNDSANQLVTAVSIAA
jgi:hypothetical protein